MVQFGSQNVQRIQQSPKAEKLHVKQVEAIPPKTLEIKHEQKVSKRERV